VGLGKNYSDRIFRYSYVLDILLAAVALAAVFAGDVEELWLLVFHLRRYGWHKSVPCEFTYQ